MKGRKRDRSKTPEVAWELLPSNPTLPEKGAEKGPSRSRSVDKKIPNGARPGPDPAVAAAHAAEAEREAWRRLVIVLAQVKGDRKVEALLKEKHPELLTIADRCGASGKVALTLTAAKDSAREWFARGLRGGNQHGPAARAKLCKVLAAQLQEHAATLCTSTPAQLQQVLDRGRAEEEGPLICSLMARELRGSRYEGLWISRKAPGHYYLGDEHEGAHLPSTDKDGDPIHPRVHAVVKMVNDQLVISGFFLDPEDDTMSPAKVPIGPFLSVYFEGMSVREASAAWKNGPPRRATRPDDSKVRSVQVSVIMPTKVLIGLCCGIFWGSASSQTGQDVAELQRALRRERAASAAAAAGPASHDAPPRLRATFTSSTLQTRHPHRRRRMRRPACPSGPRLPVISPA
ncbi:unnamed protein product [Effrenium voratum]|nr:unnamed protein product [Effrenium voratum]